MCIYMINTYVTTLVYTCFVAQKATDRKHAALSSVVSAVTSVLLQKSSPLRFVGSDLMGTTVKSHSKTKQLFT